ncbi:GNAT family N-acetyltransferase [Thalassotalea sp. LPB0316]|uniref:GNAT family N-acetyltransferase n=1 Tax=Thalassotalea sp. LPB0316 TaxID=2769490 RepID=UPI0018674684|nr:GNAT family N-acetyltransferase [Thalassotalea sp. LPB0316]QOL25854.1 GNAT family N-acetyltransferase [Thalassotalea sp. LPB0316]
MKRNSATKSLCPIHSSERVFDIYQQLSKHQPVSFFNSWPWFSTWLACLPDDIDVKFVVHYEGKEPMSCFFLGINRQRQNKLTKQRGYLNCTGIEALDELTIEYNDIISASPKHSEQLISAFLDLDDIEELRIAHSQQLDFTNIDKFYIRKTTKPAFCVALNNFNSLDDYQRSLSKNTRKQIKQSFNAYQGKFGELSLTLAHNTEQALAYLTELKELHQNYWQAKGKKGAFASAFFCQFHQKLIEDYFEQGLIQLIKVSSKAHTLGYLYNFIHNEEVLFYQSGFNYLADNKFRPGLVAHNLAIDWALNNGMSNYNFLASNAKYKKRLANKHDMLTTWVLSKKTLKGHVEHLLRKLY